MKNININKKHNFFFTTLMNNECSNIKVSLCVCATRSSTKWNTNIVSDTAVARVHCHSTTRQTPHTEEKICIVQPRSGRIQWKMRA